MTWRDKRWGDAGGTEGRKSVPEREGGRHREEFLHSSSSSLAEVHGLPFAAASCRRRREGRLLFIYLS